MEYGKAKIIVITICVVILGWSVIYWERGRVENRNVTGSSVQQVRAKTKLPTVQEDKVLDKKPTSIEAEKAIKGTTQEKNLRYLQEEMVEDLSIRAIKLLEFPPPNIEIEIADIKIGPTSIKGVYKFQKDEKFQVNSYILASDSKDSEAKEWFDLGTFSHEVKDVNTDTKVATIIQKQTSSGKTSLQPQSKLTISSSKTLYYPNGKIISLDVIEIDGGSKGFRSTIKKESATLASLTFPDHEISKGQSWQIEDEENKANKVIFKFENYCTINGIECMKIVVDSTVISKIDYRDGWDNQNYQIQYNARTTGAYYFDYERGITKLSDLVSEVKIKSELPQGDNTENSANFFRKVTYIKD